jgi:cellulose synthase/poly-beta-1,6-N-acetylglucosamine synthase-like glycosyltransferase
MAECFVLLFLVAYAISFGALVFLGWFRQQVKEKKAQNSRVLLEEITLIIPFRDEAHRLEGLLSSIVSSDRQVNSYIFVNDHSSDDSVALIKKKLQGFPILIIDLPSGLSGKKQAIKFGIHQAQTNYILTLDADVSFEKNYLNALTNLESADLYILPVLMKADNFFHSFFEFDVLLINALNAWVSGWCRPIVASGANLLISKSSYETCSRFSLHENIASGDDVYLMKDLREENKEILLSTSSQLLVITETPRSWREFLNQRIRWIAKTGHVNDPLANSIGIGQAIFAMGFLALIIFLLISSNYGLFWALFGIKCLLDFIFFSPYFKRFKRFNALMLLPIYQVSFPFYQFLLLFLLPFFKPTWKGRQTRVVKQ